MALKSKVTQLLESAVEKRIEKLKEKENKSMKTNETRPQDPNEKKWYQSAKLPWGIILFATVVTLSFALGWHTHQNYEQSYSQSVKNEASAMVQTKVNVSKQ